MKKKQARKTEEYDYHAYWRNDDKPEWYAVYTWYVNGEAQITITAADCNPATLFDVCFKAMWRAQQGLGDGNLLLPNMGDFEVRYFGPR